MDLVKKIDELADTIKETDQFKTCKETKGKFEKDSKAGELLNSFQNAKGELAILKDGNFDGVDEQKKKVNRLSNQVLDNKEIQEYLRAKKNYQQLVEQVAARLSEKIDFPVHKPKKKYCCR